MKMSVFWDVAPYGLADTDRRFGGAYCLHHQDDHKNVKTPHNSRRSTLMC
jgi:hypothetical protein